MYESKLTIKETQKAIKIVKDEFERKLANSLNLDRVSAPIIVASNDGINDDLGLKDSALKFHINTLNYDVEIVQSLAKWKRIALKKYGYNLNEGIYTDMNAIRPQDVVDNTHSLYVDQWDWELIINDEQRSIEFLKLIVKKIVDVIYETKELVKKTYPVLTESIEKEVFFIDSEELDKMYLNKSMREKEHLITKKYKTVFIKRIGKVFDNGNRHDLRAPDYDDWQLNGDLLIWSSKLNDAVELSSMGIRVNEKSLVEQLHYANKENTEENKYYQGIINNTLPLTIGGGIGQSRICMILLEKIHIAEVQASLWNEKEMNYFVENKINFL